MHIFADYIIDVYVICRCMYTYTYIYILSLFLYGPVIHFTYQNSAQLKGVEFSGAHPITWQNSLRTSPGAQRCCQWFQRKNSTPPDRMRPTWVLMPSWPRSVWTSAWPTWAATSGARSPPWRAAWRPSWAVTWGARRPRRSGARHSYCGGWSVSTWKKWGKSGRFCENVGKWLEDVEVLGKPWVISRCEKGEGRNPARLVQGWKMWGSRWK